MYIKLLQLVIALDKKLNLRLGGLPDETLSARCYRESDIPPFNKWRKRIDKLIFWEENHCEKSYKHGNNYKHSTN